MVWHVAVEGKFEKKSTESVLTTITGNQNCTTHIHPMEVYGSSRHAGTSPAVGDLMKDFLLFLFFLSLECPTNRVKIIQSRTTSVLQIWLLTPIHLPQTSQLLWRLSHLLMIFSIPIHLGSLSALNSARPYRHLPSTRPLPQWGPLPQTPGPGT